MLIELQAHEGVPSEQANAARDRIAALEGNRTAGDGRLTLLGLRSLNGGQFYVAEASATVDGRQLVVRATGDSALAAASSVAEQLSLRIRPAGDHARMLLPGDWLAWAREARSGWRWRRNALIRELQFRDFDNGIAFLEEVGRRAADYSRRPDMSISGGRVRLTIANPHHAGITLAELRLAAKVNMVVQELADDRLSGPKGGLPGGS
jgi:pterin-4a-carbinolamine dehydratase